VSDRPTTSGPEAGVKPRRFPPPQRTAEWPQNAKNLEAFRARGSPDQEDGPLSPDGGARAASGRWQGRRHVEDHVAWTLDPDQRSASARHTARLIAGYSSRLLGCTQCGAVRVAGEACFHCGFLPQRPPHSVDFEDGELGLVDHQIRRAKKFGAWPRWGSSPQPIPPTPEVRAWVRSRLIAYAKVGGAA
jgi:hypothetical protein